MMQLIRSKRKEGFTLIEIKHTVQKEQMYDKDI